MLLRRLSPCSELISSSLSVSSSRSYAAAASKGGKAPVKAKKASVVSRGSGRLSEGPGDARLEVIRKTLFESSPSDVDRLSALAKVIPSLEAHETITRAWALHQRTHREAHALELANKYASMQRAVELLEKTDKTLFDKAVGGKKFQNVTQTGSNSRLVGLVPRELRVAFDSPASGGMWDSNWKSVKKA